MKLKKNGDEYNPNENAGEIRSEVQREYTNLSQTSGESSHNEINDNENYNEDNYLENVENLIIEDIDNNTFLLSSYTTNILTNDSNRYNNIKIVADRLNGYILGNGETFSYNVVCGPYGESDGFLEAPILLSDGTETNGFGGGVCQLSSTLYNAVKSLDVDITERHHHSAPVAYVPENEDATVSMQSDLDFKFVNNTGYTLRFETIYDPDTLSVYVYQQ